MRLRPFALVIVATSSLAAAAPVRAPAPADAPRTYCNPLPIPDYPVGRNVRGLKCMASSSPIYASSSLLGPFKELGRPTLTAGLPDTTDPMLFVDDDGRLFFSLGCTETRGIFGIELDRSDPARTIGEAKKLIPFSPDAHPWERVGEFNQRRNAGWVEGSWMIKRQGRYYLTYSAAGTEHRAYAMEAYVGTSPLGPQVHNPIFRTTAGLVTGTAHGSIPRATSTPQWLQGRGPDGRGPSDTGWIPVNGGVQTLGSSRAPGHHRMAKRHHARRGGVHGVRQHRAKKR